VTEALVASRAAGTAVAVELDGDAWQVAAVQAGRRPLGAMALRRSAPLDDAEVRAFERAGQVLAMLLLLEQSIADAEQRTAREFLAELLGGPHSDLPELTRRARRQGLPPGAVTLVVAQVPPEDLPIMVRLAVDRCARSSGLAAEHDGRIAAVLPGEHDQSAAEALHGVLSAAASAPVTAVTGAVPSLAGLPDAYALTVRGLKLLLALGRSGEVGTASDLAMYSALLADPSDEALDAFLRDALGPVLDHDRDRSGDLAATWLAYLDAGGSPRTAARMLHVHVNTVLQRLRRIDALVGDSWRTPGRTLERHVALRLNSLRRTLR
jgi:sugar diacid utilization regulator